MDFLLFEYDPIPYYNIVDLAGGLGEDKENEEKLNTEMENEAETDDLVILDEDESVVDI